MVDFVYPKPPHPNFLHITSPFASMAAMAPSPPRRRRRGNESASAPSEIRRIESVPHGGVGGEVRTFCEAPTAPWPRPRPPGAVPPRRRGGERTRSVDGSREAVADLPLTSRRREHAQSDAAVDGLTASPSSGQSVAAVASASPDVAVMMVKERRLHFTVWCPFSLIAERRCHVYRGL